MTDTTRREIKFRVVVGNKAIGDTFNIHELAFNRIFHSELIEHITFSQYTGLKDASGREIYEGDILKQEDILYEVLSLYSLAYDRLNPESFEVIGNIYENPELLKSY